ncbi:hypothetical protein PybrP1_008017 [[Pythium] brassicae (nom. inval.)]|nr:hypothetical protein PybrP1_008017 [[Pythium] brassicae (nom. inval.)]
MAPRKALAVVPALGSESRLERFHGDAVERPLLKTVTWSTQGEAVRKRQLALAGHRMLELQRAQPPAPDARSWFVGNNVQQDGSVLLFTPFDPLFVLLASSWRQRSRAMALSDLLAQDHNSWLLRADVCSEEKVAVICDVQGGGSLDDLFVTANEAKILKWLRAKATRVAKTLALEASNSRASSGFGSVDANFVLPAQSGEGPSKERVVEGETLPPPPGSADCTRDAVELLGDYLPLEVKELLYKELNIEKQAPVAKHSAAPGNPRESFQRFDRRLQEVEDGRAGEGSKRTPPPASATAAKKKSKLASVDRTGMKSLTSFFGKK